MKPLWVIRISFLFLCAITGYALGDLRPDWLANPYAIFAGFGMGGVLIAFDEMLKGFSLRAFSAATFGLLLGFVVAQLIDHSGLFDRASEDVRLAIRLGLFLSIGYVGMILALRSNKDDFSLIIPYVRFRAQDQPQNIILLDTSIIIDGRIADLIEANFVDGVLVVPKFVLKELQFVADSEDAGRRARGRRGFEMLNRLQQNKSLEVRIHDAEIAEERDVDSKLVLLARALGAILYTNDHNLAAVAELQAVRCINLSRLSVSLRPVILPGEVLTLRISREGKERGQGVGYLSDGTMVVVNQAHPHIGQQVQAQVQALHQTGAGIIVFAELKNAA